MSRRSVKLELEQLEERAVPSGTPIPVPDHSAAALVVANHSHVLGGLGNGTFTRNSPIADAGLTFHLSGHGHFGQLGAVQISGVLHGVGLLHYGRPDGTITFTNAHGSVTIALTGPNLYGFSEVPNWFSYSVVSGTGDYQNLHDHGILRISYHFTPMALPLHGGSGPATPGTTAGTFRLAL